MKLSEFTEIFIAALYNETLISGRLKFTVGEILDLYSLKLEPIWSNKLVHDSYMKACVGLKNRPVDLENEDVELTAHGLRHVETRYKENVNTFLESVGVVRRESSVSRDEEAPFSWTDVNLHF